MVGPILIAMAVLMIVTKVITSKHAYQEGYRAGRRTGYQSGWLRGIEAERRAHQEDEDNKPNEHLTYAGTEDNP